MRLMRNCFEPSQKLLSKRKDGAKIKKSYNIAGTPFGQVPAYDAIACEIKEAPEKELGSINPVQLRKGIIKKLGRLQNLFVKQ